MSEVFDFCVNEFKSTNMNSTTKRMNLGFVIDKLNYLDFSPPYQRGKVWKRMYFTDLFRSIFDETPIGALHFVLKSEENDDVKYVLDGKQRLLTIKAFVDNEFSLRIKDSDNKINYVFWRNVIDPNSKWHFLHTKIMSYQVDVVNWKPRDFEQQRVIFGRVNNSVSLNAWERIYGDNFIVKKLLQHILQEHFTSKTYLNKSISEDFRQNGLKLVHMILISCFGPKLNTSYEPRHLSSKFLEDSAQEIQKWIIEAGYDASIEFDTQIIDNLKLAEKLGMLRKANEWFENAIMHKNCLVKDKKFESNFVADIISFFIMKMQQKILTTPYVQQNFDKLINFILCYKLAKDKNNTFKRRSTDATSIKTRKDAMEKLYVECGLDNNVKKKDCPEMKNAMLL